MKAIVPPCKQKIGYFNPVAVRYYAFTHRFVPAPTAVCISVGIYTFLQGVKRKNGPPKKWL